MGRLGLLLLSLSLLLAGCDREPVDLKVRPDVVEKGDTARRTLLVYMMAENSLDGFAALDVAEIVKAVPGVPRDCRLFVYTDDAGFPLLTHYFNMENGDVGNSNAHPFSKDVCSSDTAALGKVLDFILKDYPTVSLDVVMWSHGTGWLRAPLNAAPQRSIGIDNGENSYSNNTVNSIEVEELAALLKRLPTKVDRLMYDDSGTGSLDSVACAVGGAFVAAEDADDALSDVVLSDGLGLGSVAFTVLGLQQGVSLALECFAEASLTLDSGIGSSVDVDDTDSALGDALSFQLSDHGLASGLTSSLVVGGESSLSLNVGGGVNVPQRPPYNQYRFSRQH